MIFRSQRQLDNWLHDLAIKKKLPEAVREKFFEKVKADDWDRYVFDLGQRLALHLAKRSDRRKK